MINVVLLTGYKPCAIGVSICVYELNRTVDSCVYRKNHGDLQRGARAVWTFPVVPRSTQPSTLRGMVNEYQLSD